MNKNLFSICILALSFIMISCSKKKENNITYNVDNDGNYTGFDNVNDYISVDDAVDDGCYVELNSKYSGVEHWQKFCETALKGENANLRIVILSDSNKN